MIDSRPAVTTTQGNNYRLSNFLGTHSTDLVDTTQRLAAMLAKDLPPGAIIALTGPLGAGKTHFVKGLALGLDIKEIITSPTFVLHNQYSGTLHSQAITLNHLDLYRLKSLEEVLAIGMEEQLNGDSVTVIEWPELIREILPPETIWVQLSIVGETQREIVISWEGSRANSK